MAIGLSEQELNKLLSFGDTEQEIADNITECLDEKAGERGIILSVISLLKERVMVAILENNRRINEQLISAGLRV